MNLSSMGHLLTRYGHLKRIYYKHVEMIAEIQKAIADRGDMIKTIQKNLITTLSSDPGLDTHSRSSFLCMHREVGVVQGTLLGVGLLFFSYFLRKRKDSAFSRVKPVVRTHKAWPLAIVYIHLR